MDDKELDAILLQYHAEQNQGLNELAGRGTADEQLKKALNSWHEADKQRAMLEAKLQELENIEVHKEHPRRWAPARRKILEENLRNVQLSKGGSDEA